MTAKMYKTGLIITGDAKGGIKAMQMTGKELTNLKTKQQAMSKFTRASTKDVNQLSASLASVGHKAVAWGAGILAAKVGLAQLSKELAVVDKIGKMSDRIGASTESLSEYAHVADLTGTSLDQLSVAWQRQVRRISEAAQGSGEAKNALKELGLSAEALSKMSPDKQFEILADALDGVASQGDRVRLAMKFWDSEGVSLLQTVKGGSAELQRMREEARALGLSLSGKQVDDIEAFNDSVTRLSNGMSGLVRTGLASVARNLADATDWLVENADGLRRVGETLLWIGGAGVGALVAYNGALYLSTLQTAGLAARMVGLRASVAGVMLGMQVAPLATMNTALWGTTLSATAASGALGVLKISLGVLFAAFAGWQLGSYLRDEFVEARVAGLAFVGVMLKGWEHIKYAFNVMGAAISHGWQLYVAGWKQIIAEFLSGVATAFSFVPGMADVAAKLEGYAQGLRNSANGVGTLSDKIDKLKASRDAELMVIDDTITDLVAYELAAANAKEAKDQLEEPPRNTSSSGALPLDEVVDKNRELVDLLQDEYALMLLGERERRVQIETRKLDKNATLEQVAAVRDLVEKMYDYDQELKKPKTVELLEKELSGMANRVAATLQDSIATGDWSGLGVTVGGIFAGSLAAVVTDGLVKAMGSSAFSSVLGPVVGGVVGGLAALAVSKVADYFSGDDFDPTEQRQAAQGAGTVLGSIEAKSESIAKATDAIQRASETLVNINTGMLQALNSLRLGIDGVVSMALRETRGASFTAPKVNENLFSSGFGKLNGGFFDVIGSIFSVGLFNSLGKAIGKALGGRSKKIDDGIRLLGGNIQDLVEGSLVEAYATFKSRSSVFSKYKVSQEFDALGDDVNRQFGLVFGGIIDSVSEGATALGVSADLLKTRLDQVIVNDQLISLEGLDAGEQQAAIEAVFSTIFDTAVTTVVPYLADMQQAGEGLGETLARVSTEFQLAKEAALTLGFRVPQTMGEIAQFPELLGKMGDALSALPIPTEMLVKAADDLIQRTGGIEAFTAALSGFEKNFLSEAEQTENLSRRLGEAMGNLPLPETREGFAALFKNQNALTDSGRENIATLLNLQGVADQYYDLLESGAEDLTAVAVSFSEKVSDLMASFERTFAPEQFKQDKLFAGLTSALAGIGATLPETRGGFWDLMHSLDATTESGQSAISTLLDVQGQADEYYNHLETIAQDAATIAKEASDKAASALEQMLSLKISNSDDAITRLRESVGAKKDSLTTTYDKKVQDKNDGFSDQLTRIRQMSDDYIDSLKSAEDVRLEANSKALDAARDGLQQISAEVGGLSSALGRLRESSVSSSILRGQALATLARALSSGNFTGVGDAANVAANINAGDYATAVDFAREQGVTRNLLGQLESSGLQRVSAAELTIQRLETQTAVIRESAEAEILDAQANAEYWVSNATMRHEAELADMEEKHLAELAELDEIIVNAEAQLNVLRGIDTGIGTIGDELARFAVALEEEVLWQKRNQLDAAAIMAGLAAWAPAMNDAGIEVPGFASGGSFGGGVRVVGERGPEIEFTGPSRIMSNSDSRALFDSSSIVNELQNLGRRLEVLEQYTRQTTSNTAQSVKYAKRWDVDGLPPERVA